MKAKHIILSLFLSFTCLAMHAQTPLNENDAISVTTAYVDQVSMAWYVNSTVTNKPLLINYNIGTEYRWDYVKIYSIDGSGNEILLVSLSGVQSGSISSIIPTGKIKITFTSDGSVNYQTYPSICTGVFITFSVDNNPNTSSTFNDYTAGNSIVNGNVGIGVLNPSYKLEVNGTAKFLENVECGRTISFLGPNHFTVTSATVPTLRSPSVTMPIWGIEGVLTTGSADLWLAGDNAVRMFAGNNPAPAVSVLKSGNVGIGTPTPSAKLDVNGEIQSSSNIIARSELVSSRNDVNIGGTLLLENPAKTGNGQAKSWRIYNMGGNYGNSLQFWAYDNLGCVQGGMCAPRLILSDNGNVGIGGGFPQSKLDVDGEINMSGRLGMYINTPSQCFTYDGKTMGHYSIGWLQESTCTSSGPSLLMSGYGSVKLFTTGVARLAINNQGKVGIGLATPDVTMSTTPSDEMLTVNGAIHAKEVRVDLTGSLADYVFSPTYSLMPLHKVEEYVKANSHLPEIPSAAEVKENGLGVGEMQNKLLQKVEELTLYVIDLQKANEAQSSRIQELEKKLDK